MSVTMSAVMVRGKEAVFVRKIEGWRSDARLYRVDPPMPYAPFAGDPGEDFYATPFVIVSAVVASDTVRAETFIFSATEEGEPLDWLELDGSFEGALDHEEHLRQAGYAVITDN